MTETFASCLYYALQPKAGRRVQKQATWGRAPREAAQHYKSEWGDYRVEIPLVATPPGE